MFISSELRDTINEALDAIAGSDGSLFGVTLSWFDEAVGYGIPEDITFTFPKLEDAVAFAYNLAYTPEAHEYNDPKDIYVKQIPVSTVELGDKVVPTIVDDDDATFLFSYMGADEYCKISDKI